MNSRDLDKSNRSPCYIYELPYKEKKMVCNILDINDKWEELGGMYMKYDCATLYKISKAVVRNRSPSEELLCLWGTQNHTILDLFVLLAKMHHYQAMRILKPFVDSKYHHLIYEGEEHMSQLVSRSDSETLKGHLIYNEIKNSTRSSITSNEKYKMGQISGENDSKFIDKENYNNGRVKSQHVSSTFVSPESCTLHISYKELELATNSWDKNNILGKGGFGIVFKGTWKNTAVAIKRLEPQRTDEEEYDVLEAQRQQSIKELRYLNSYRHDNILPLYGYSIGGEKSCLVYQYMPNGSLEDRIQCRNRSKPLSWLLRHKIATGTARGLQFLHGMDTPLVHGDIKSANILLDPHFEPRIGDFGLAREGPLEQYTHVKVSKVHGTRPYLPDEFLRGKKFSTKVDTYSFGVVLFEIATGLRAYDDMRPKKFLKDYVDEYDENRMCDLIDIKAGTDDAHTFPAIVALGKWCVRTRPKDRPDMVQVLRQLDGMMAARDMANKGQYLVRQNSVSPSTPYEMQLLHDHHTQMRRLSFSPSGSYHPQPWLFASHAPNNNHVAIGSVAPIITHRSCSPSTQITDSHPNPARMMTPTANNNEGQLDNSTPPIKLSQIVNSSAYPPYPPPPYINVFPPSVVHRLPSLMSKSSDYSSSMSNLPSEQEISTYSERPNNDENDNHATTLAERQKSRMESKSISTKSNLSYHPDPMIPMISELKITQNATENETSQ